MRNKKNKSRVVRDFKTHKTAGEWGPAGLYKYDHNYPEKKPEFVCSIEDSRNRALDMAKSVIDNQISIFLDTPKFRLTHYLAPYDFICILKVPENSEDEKKTYEEITDLANTDAGAWDCCLYLLEEKYNKNRAIPPALFEWAINNLNGQLKRPGKQGVGKDEAVFLATRNQVILMAVNMLECNTDYPVYACGNGINTPTIVEIIQEACELLGYDIKISTVNRLIKDNNEKSGRVNGVGFGLLGRQPMRKYAVPWSRWRNRDDEKPK